PLRNRCEGGVPFAARRCNSTQGACLRHNHTHDGAAIELEPGIHSPAWTKETVMKLTIVAFAALSAVIAATPADASPRITSLGVVGNGLSLNGILNNGIIQNGLFQNGLFQN